MCVLVLAILFLPVALSLTSLYGWTDAEANGADPLWQAKHAYLNVPWFLVRAAIFLLCWAGLAWRMWSLSTKQDRTGDPALTRMMAATSTWGTILLALTSTYAAFDWLMSFDYRWYSTMYGIYFWIGSILGSLAALTLIVVVLRTLGFLREIITAEHLQDLGKLLFTFVVFWAYIAFSQYLLIWYANLSEETPWYLTRLQGSWSSATVLLALGQFVVPFVVLLSRSAKRSDLILGAVAAWLLVFHYVDLYWQVVPTLRSVDATPNWLDGVWLLVFVGVLATCLLYAMRSVALVPVRDPRLGESLRFHQE
jgi:hypothetical protein